MRIKKIILLAIVIFLPSYTLAQPCQSESCGNNTNSRPLPVPTASCAASCGDGVCSSSLNENTTTCPQDCGTNARCGDGVCSFALEENSRNCPQDCSQTTSTPTPTPTATSTPTPPPNSTPTPTPKHSHCGDGVCSSSFGENTKTCPKDCGVDISCGDGVCSNGENYFNCQYKVNGQTQSDCMNMCGDGICQSGAGETKANCDDCKAKCNNNGQCETGEDSKSCPNDCFCGDGICCNGENAKNCAEDCCSGCHTPNGLCPDVCKVCPKNLTFKNGFCVDCAGKTNGNAIFDECGVCGGNGSSCQCNLYSVSLKLLDSKTPIDVAVGSGASLDCVKKIIGTCTKAMRGNDCDSNVFLNFKRQITNLKASGIGKFGGTEYTSGLMDKNCNVIAHQAGEKVCGSLLIQAVYSPISLLWDNTKELNDLRLVNFALSPESQKSWSIWRASQHAPLLVYDPEHTGDVNSYKQLFGNWTFGGKQTAYLERIIMNSPLQTSAWRDGYEALATLDSNNDGKISGSELTPLGLWFDKNQDGISQTGEVKNLTETGVISLFTIPNSRDPLTGDLKASIGYERVVDGTLVTGASVDWYGEGFQSQLEAMLKLQARGSVFENLLSTAPEVKTPTPTSKPNYSSLIAGPWQWHIDPNIEITDKRDYAPKGVLTLNEQEGGILAGHSIVETDLIKPVGEAVKSITFIPLEGNVSMIDGKTSIQFIVKTTDGSMVSTEAVLSADGKTLSGTTTTSVPASSGKMNTLEFSYSWTAEKML